MVACQAPVCGSFEVVRLIGAPYTRVMQAYSDRPLRSRWFRIPGQAAIQAHELDFRSGGYERLEGETAVSGRPERLHYLSRFIEICADNHIALQYEFAVYTQPRWASTVVIGLEASGHGTVLRHREQYALLHYSGDGAQDSAHLKGGVSLGLNGLAHAIDASIELAR